MVMKMLRSSTLALLVAVSLTVGVYAEPINKSAQEVFAKWYDWQIRMPNKNLTDMTPELDGDKLKQQYVSAIHTLADITPFLELLTASYINKDGFILRSTVPAEITQNFGMIHNMIQNDMPGFISFLKKSPLLTKELVKGEQFDTNTNHIIDKYNNLFSMLFAHRDQVEASRYLFTVANHFYEYAFEEDTFRTFERMMLNPEDQPLARMLYTVIWYNLAGNGWKHWHEDSLKSLEGKKAKYIAGGSDLIQMLNAGVYDITNIDPQLPSQPKYYANGWEFIIRSEATDGGIGDTISIPLQSKTITMERTGFMLSGETFKARLNTNEIIEIPHSITTWSIKDEDGTPLGKYQLDRRFCKQEDFVAGENESLVMSFNELYFIALPNFLNGWQIDPTLLPADLKIVVKQLRKPVTREMLFNMRIASLLNATDFKFIALGTCIN